MKGRLFIAWAMRILPALADQLNLGRETLFDRLASAWIDGHASEAAELVRKIDSLVHPWAVPSLPLPLTPFQQG